MAKLAQYEVKGSEEDLKIIKRIVSNANWSSIKVNSYVKYKLEEFGKKVLLNAPNSEYAWNLLESIGLREKLIEMDGSQIQTQDSLSWWMSKEPLRSSPIGEGDKRMAREIFENKMNHKGEIIVSHETNSFHAYENITRSSKGWANAFISRDNIIGEQAAFGDGFYTRLGENGAIGTGLTIRFKLNPNAREGTDFEYKDDYIIVKNKKVLTLIQENLGLNILGLLQLLKSGGIKRNDKGLLEKLKRKFAREKISPEEFKEAIDFMKQGFHVADDFPEEYRFDFSAIKISSVSDIIDVFIYKRHNYYEETLAPFFYKGIYRENLDWIEALIKTEHQEALYHVASYVLSDEHWVEFPHLVRVLIEKGNNRVRVAILQRVLSKKHWVKHPELVEYLLQVGNDYVLRHVARYVLSKEYWADHPEWIFALIKNADSDMIANLDLYVFSKDYWMNHPELKSYLSGRSVTLSNLDMKSKVVNFTSWAKTHREKSEPLTCTALLMQP